MPDLLSPPASQSEHSLFLRLLKEAQLAHGQVAPNPLVACGILRNSELIATGHHEYYGQAHAEKNALGKFPSGLPSGSSVFVTLEPCSHHGKTPPCADALIAAKPSEVIVGTLDSNPKVQGAGIAKLKTAGISVRMAEESIQRLCRFQNRRFFCAHEEKRPYIILKWAESADAFLAAAQGTQTPISCQESLQLSHRWRSEEQAILVGSETLHTDNPELTCRLFTSENGAVRNPLRIVLDRRGRVTKQAHIFNEGSRTLYCGPIRKDLPTHVEQCEYIQQTGLSEILQFLLEQKIHSVIVEGGAEIHRAFLAEDLWDELRVIKSARKLGNGVPAASTQHLPKHSQIEFISGSDSVSITFRKFESDEVLSFAKDNEF
jgi:diaminohydroxyphosphoribosylaminopyrimidine deaminase/5-amino-6-(5-phosphoribosylamino)uracil reductase